MPYQQIQQVLPDLLTVYAGTGKIIVFSQTKRDCDAISESLKRALPTEVSSLSSSLCGGAPQRSCSDHCTKLLKCPEERVLMQVLYVDACKGLFRLSAPFSPSWHCIGIMIPSTSEVSGKFI